MKRIILSIMAVFFLSMFNSNIKAEQNQKLEKSEIAEVEFKVLGLCGMCEDRIEKAAYSVRGVRSASWDQESQILQVSFRTKKTDQETIERAIAEAGHDTKNFITDEETYSNLHHCCKYPRDKKMLENNKLYNEE